jgi:hypothetical protein
MKKISTLAHFLLGLIIVLTLIAAEDGCETNGTEEEPAATSTVEVKGQHIVDLVEQGKVEAKSTGSGIESVSLEVRRLVEEVLKAVIPAGTFFVSGGSTQDMVATDEEEIILIDDEWVSAVLDVACANLELDVPDSDVTFDIRRAPQQEQLEILMPALRDAGVPYEVRQAAVWIVTDDADYDDLGTLVSGWGIGGSRIILETEAALAMKIVDEAGIDITSRSIWWDRDLILQGLEDGSLRNWLQQRAG